MIEWAEVQKAIFPIKNYEDACRRLKVSMGYRFAQVAYNFPIRVLENYTQQLLGGDLRGRYAEYNSILKEILEKLHISGVKDVCTLIDETAGPGQLETLVVQSGVQANEIATVLKYLIYWVIPAEKYLGGLVRPDSDLQPAIQALRNSGVRTNLELLQGAITAQQRTSLAKMCNLPLKDVVELVHRADFSRLPWASKATISNIIGAGYTSMKQLANADLERLVVDYLQYGKAIGKNLKLGNEIESSYRIAKIVPAVLLES